MVQVLMMVLPLITKSSHKITRDDDTVYNLESLDCRWESFVFGSSMGWRVKHHIAKLVVS